MKGKIRILKTIIILVVIFFMPDATLAESRDSTSFLSKQRFVHRIGIDLRPEYIIPANNFLKGENEKMQPIRNSFSTHLKYSFQSHSDSYIDRIFGGSYQGIGLAYYTFGEKKCMGDPLSLYLFQGARLARLNNRLAFNYEWNLGISSGWVPHDFETNHYNTIIGSKLNAYINANFYLNWMLSHKLDLITGVSLTHFSNGNTGFPNGGLNSVGLKTGLVYNFNRKSHNFSEASFLTPISEFPRHISYDLVLFGSWRRKGVKYGDERILSPHSYNVLGFNFAPMYNVGYKFRAGVSLDGYYDGSANIYSQPYITGTEPKFFKPPLHEQLALGISGRTEYVMPYFSVNIGLGVNILQSGYDLKTIYQVLALKIKVTQSSFIHIGYSLQNFDTPSFLMLGVGFRFNNKYPSLQH